MSHGEKLHYREMARRKALLALASLLPGNPRVFNDINVLDGIELCERHDTSKQSGRSRHEGIRNTSRSPSTGHRRRRHSSRMVEPLQPASGLLLTCFETRYDQALGRLH
jgi:hypothetical protein